MKRFLLNLLGALAVSSALNLQLSTALAQGTSFKLLTTFTDPTPAAGDSFGRSVAAAGTDRVLIGAPGDSTAAASAGAAYLFSTNGAWLTTFTKPTPDTDESFGSSVAAVGTDRVLIGASSDHTGAPYTGAAYLFSTNGTLLTTFTNPTPGAGDGFGSSVAAVGTERVLIGAPYDNTGAIMAGAAYLFSTNGALLITFTNPVPTFVANFGSSVAAVGTERVLIGAPSADLGAGTVGVSYLFSIQPVLGIRLTATNTVAVSWPSPSTDWTLQEDTNGVASVNWSNAPGPIQDDGTNKTLIVSPPAGERYYRLFKTGG